MKDVMKKRVVGAAVLVILGIALPLMLARCMQGGGEEQSSMRVYEVAPDGQARPASGQDDSQQAQAIDGSSGVGADREASAQSPDTPDLPEAVSPSSEPDAPQPAASESTPEPEPAPEPRETQQPTGASTAAVPNESESGGSLRQRQSLSGYVVQVASFGDEANAERLARELNSEFKAFYRAGDVNGKTYYRVRVGPFENEASANAAAERLRSSGRATLVRRAE